MYRETFSLMKAQIHPLTAAAASGCEDLVILLLDNGAKVDLQDRVHSSICDKAVNNDHNCSNLPSFCLVGWQYCNTEGMPTQAHEDCADTT